MQRRSFLKGAGVVTVVVLGGGVWRAYDQGVFSVGKGPAYEPWKDWRKNSDDGALVLVRAAILAASPHNTQPWLFRVTNSSIELYIDTKRNVGALDPYLREEHIGMGCAVENLALAAAANGYQATVTLLPGKLTPAPVNPKLKQVAGIDLAPGQKQQSELYDAIPHRHTNRNPYHLNALPSGFVDGIRQLVSDEPDVKMFLFTAVTDRDHIVDMISKANDIMYGDPEVDEGSERWMRTNWSDVQKFRDGLIVDEFGESPLTAAMRKFMAPSLVRWAFRHKLMRTMSYVDVLHATPLFGLIAVRDRYDQEQNLRAGRIWQRLHLLATARGVAGRPVNEAVELLDHQRMSNQEPQAMAALSGLTGDKDWQPTFMFRFGYPVRQVSPSPRRPVKDVLL
jgi:nitroreductase